MLLLYILAPYFFLLWVVARLAVPHLGFSKEPIPERLPDELQKKISELNETARDNIEFLRLAYAYVTTRYVGHRVKTVTQFWVAFLDPMNAPPASYRARGRISYCAPCS